MTSDSTPPGRSRRVLCRKNETRFWKVLDHARSDDRVVARDAEELVEGAPLARPWSTSSMREMSTLGWTRYFSRSSGAVAWSMISTLNPADFGAIGSKLGPIERPRPRRSSANITLASRPSAGGTCAGTPPEGASPRGDSWPVRGARRRPEVDPNLRVAFLRSPTSSSGLSPENRMLSMRRARAASRQLRARTTSAEECEGAILPADDRRKYAGEPPVQKHAHPHLELGHVGRTTREHAAWRWIMSSTARACRLSKT